MTLIKKIFSLVLCTVALYGNEEHSKNMAQFMNALSMYKQEPTAENAAVVVFEFDKPENMGRNRPLMKQHLTRAGIPSIQKLRIEARTVSSTQENLKEPGSENETPKRSTVESEELTIRKDTVTLKTITAQLAELEQKIINKERELPGEEASIVDLAVMININSIKGQANNLHPLLKQIEKTIKLQEEIQQLREDLAKKQKQKATLESRLEQREMNLQKKRTDHALQQAQLYRDHLKNLTQNIRRS